MSNVDNAICLDNAISLDEAGAYATAATENSRHSQPVGWVFIASYAFALFGVWMLVMTPATIGLAMKANQVAPEGAAAAYSLIAGAGALIALLANPMFGRLSDITRSRWGMRRPWMAGGVVGGSLAATVMAMAENVTGLFVGWALMQFFINAAIAALIAVIADQVPLQQRGLLSGVAGMTPTAGILAGTYFVQLMPGNNLFIFLVPALVAIISVGLFVVLLNDRRLANNELPRFGVAEFFGSFYIDPRAAPSFCWYLLSMFLIAGALAVIQTYMFFFVQGYLKIEESKVPEIVFYAVLVMNLTALIVSPLSGVLSDYLGRRKPVFALAGLVLAAGCLAMVLSEGLSLFFVGVGLAGIGYGIYSGLYIAMATETMTDPHTNARDLGLVNIAYTLPYSLIPMSAPLLLGIGGGENYPALLTAAIFISLAGIPVLAKVRIR